MDGESETLPVNHSHPGTRDTFSYKISGFRSFDDFSVQLEPGLNVLLGSNGSGKTNFIDFLDFITELTGRNAPAAISSAGGIARVFSQESLKRKIPRVTAKICGIADLTGHLPPTFLRTLFNFEYEIDLRYSKFHTAVFIAHEKIKFKNLHSSQSSWDHGQTVGSIELTRKSPLADEPVKWVVGNYLKTKAPRNPLRHVHAYRLPGRGKDGDKIDALPALLSEAPRMAPDQSILSTSMAFPAFDALSHALSRSRSFNLNPHLARTPDDISTPARIEPNGNGLYAVIYQMQQTKRSPDSSRTLRRRFPKDALDTVLSWTQIVLPDLQDISATADPHTGKYLVHLHVSGENGTLKIPLQSASDGTLKWLAFVCLIVSHGSEYTFEEPENYLHPKMQQFFISLIRESIEDEGRRARYILSTHSETIINQCTPDELILFNFVNGSSHSSRVRNAGSLIKEVNSTGFGLGHYYVQNVVR